MIASISALIIAPLHFHGLLPFMAAFAVRQVLMANTLTADLGAWYARPTWVIGAAVIGSGRRRLPELARRRPDFGRLLEE